MRSKQPASVVHIGGVDWIDAPAPFVLHRHGVQTIGRVDGTLLARCPCGATRVGWHWINEPLSGRRVRWAPSQVLDFAKLAVLLAAVAVIVWGVVAIVDAATDASSGQTFSVQCPPGTAVVNVSPEPGESTCLDPTGRVIANR